MRCRVWRVGCVWEGVWECVWECVWVCEGVCEMMRSSERIIEWQGYGSQHIHTLVKAHKVATDAVTTSGDPYEKIQKQRQKQRGKG